MCAAHKWTHAWPVPSVHHPALDTSLECPRSSSIQAFVPWVDTGFSSICELFCFPFEIPSTGLMEICALSNQPLPIDSVVFDLFLSLVFVYFLGVKTLFSQKWHRWVLESLCQSMAFVSCLPLNFIFGRRHSKFSAGEISVDAVIWLDQWGKLFLIQTRWPVVPHCPVLCALPWTLVRGIVFF